MKNVQMKSLAQTCRRGSAMVWIIVIVVVVVIAVNIINKTKDPLASLPISENPVCSEDIYPWEEESRLLKQDQELTVSLYEGQPVIDKTIIIKARIPEIGGIQTSIIEINPDGTVSGSYSADYNEGTKPKMNKTMNGQFAGNIDPSNIYFDEQGMDKKKLFFLAKGKMSLVQLNSSSGKAAYGNQSFYVTGWVDPSYKAKGRIVMISEKGTFQTFHWE